jgi:hypothetical protein
LPQIRGKALVGYGYELRIEFDAYETAAMPERDKGSGAAAEEWIKHDAMLGAACQDRRFN